MFERLRKKLKSIQNIITNNIRSFRYMFFGLIIICLSAFAEFFGLWQMDMITSAPVWQNGWINNNYANTVFEFGRIIVFGHMIKFTTTCGLGYDTCQGLISFGWLLGIIGVFIMMYGFLTFKMAKK